MIKQPSHAHLLHAPRSLLAVASTSDRVYIHDMGSVVRGSKKHGTDVFLVVDSVCPEALPREPSSQLSPPPSPLHSTTNAL